MSDHYANLSEKYFYLSKYNVDLTENKLTCKWKLRALTQSYKKSIKTRWKVTSCDKKISWQMDIMIGDVDIDNWQVILSFFYCLLEKFWVVLGSLFSVECFTYHLFHIYWFCTVCSFQNKTQFIFQWTCINCMAYRFTDILYTIF